MQHDVRDAGDKKTTSKTGGDTCHSANSTQETSRPVSPASSQPPATSGKRFVKRSPKRKLPVAGTVDARMNAEVPADTRRRGVAVDVKAAKKPRPSKKEKLARTAPTRSANENQKTTAPKFSSELLNSQSSAEDGEEFNSLTPFLASSGDLSRKPGLAAKVEHKSLPSLHASEQAGERPPLSPGRSPFAAHIDFARPLNRSPQRKGAHAPTHDAKTDDVGSSAKNGFHDDARNLARHRHSVSTRVNYLDADDDTRDYVVVPPSMSHRPANKSRAKLSKAASSVLRSSSSLLENTTSMSSSTSSQFSLTDHQRSRHDASYLLD